MSNKQTKKGFTLVEILVVVGLIAVLAAITIIAINPAKNFADARNTQRSSDVGEILSAVTQYTSDGVHNAASLGTIPDCTGTPAHIGTGASNVNLAATLVPDPLVAMPKDPSNGTDADTGYTICTISGRFQIAAPGAENGKTISVKR